MLVNTHIDVLQKIKMLYEKDVNIIKYLKSLDMREENTVEDIMISYDFQAGSYTEDYRKNPTIKDEVVKKLAKVIDALNCPKKTIFEAGVGEATTLVPMMKHVKNKFVRGGGADISFSRTAVAKQFCRENNISNIDLAVGDMFCLPLKDNSIDVVYTYHSMEPNGGHEEEVLKELYRVTAGYLVLVEPAYEQAGDEAKQYMKEHGYVKGIPHIASKLGYKVILNELFHNTPNPLNPSGITVIEKLSQNEEQVISFCCPVTKTKLRKIGQALFSGDSMLAYPIISDIPLLRKENAVVATILGKYESTL